MTAQAKIRITTEGAQALGVLKQMRESFAQMGKDAAKAADQAEQTWGTAFNKANVELDKFIASQRGLGNSAGMQDTTRQAGKLAEQIQVARSAAVQLLATLAGAEAVRKGAELVDTYAGLSARLKLVAKDQAEYKKALEASTMLSGKYQQSLQATSASLTKTYAAIKPLGGSLQQATNVTEALMAALKAGGATTEEAASATLQFAQALGKGVLNGDEFNSISEAAPGLLRALADGIGVPTAALKEMGAAGQLTTSKIVSGLANALPQLQADAATIPATVGGAVQQVNNQLLIFVGTSDEAKAASRLLINALGAIGDNIGPIVTVVSTLATALGVFYVGKLAAAAVATVQFAYQQGVLALAARSVAAEMGIAAAATGSFLAVIGGPVGLVVMLGTLAAGWLLLNKAKKDSKVATLEDLQAERAAVERQRKDLVSKLKSGDVNLNWKTDLRDFDNQLKELDAKMAEMEQRKADALRMSGGPRGATTQDSLQDPATIANIEKEFKTRDVVEKEFRAKRDAYNLAKDAEIAQARKQGTLAYVEQLETQKTAVLKKMDDERTKAIDALDKDHQVTRLAQAVDTYNKEAALQADSLQRQAKNIEQAYADGLVSYQSYLTQRAAAEKAASDEEIKQLQQQLSAQRTALGANQGIRAKAPTANERASADDAIAKGLDTIAKLEVDIEKKKRDQVDAARARRREEENITNELRKQREEIDAMLAQATGAETPDSVARSVRKKFEPQLQSALQNDQDPAPLLKLIDVETERAKFQLLQRQFQESRDALAVGEQAVQAQKAAGLISESEAERQVLALRQASLQTLRDQAAALGQQADKLDTVAGKTQPKEQADAKRAGIDVTAVADARTEMEKTAKSSGVSAISTELKNILTGSKSATQGLRDMVGNFASSMLDLISQKLGAQLVDSLFGSSGGPGGSSSGGWVQAAASWAASFFHGGGVVAGSGGTRTFPASTWAMAPRYHTGGISGLAPNEVPAVLLKGEEVLTADDPRHVKNMGRQVGGVSVTNQVSISGAQGDKSDQAAAGNDLVEMMNTTIDAWALKQSRPGGVLAGGR